MPGVTIALFDDRGAAETAINNLSKAGYDPKQMSVIMRDTQQAKDLADNTGTSMTKGAVSGATTGGIIGGIAGLLIGIGAIAVPGVGALLIGGPVAAALGLTGAAATTVSGAVTGALAGGLVGALVKLGVPEETAKVYETRIKEGAILVAVPAAEDNDARARQILEEEGADQTKYIATDTWMGKSTIM